MLNFFMVSTVFSKKQFCFIKIFKSEDVLDYINDLIKNHNHMILYPVNTKQDVENISDLIDDKWKNAILSEIDSKKAIKSLTAKRKYGKEKVENVQFIEHLGGPTFRIKGTKNEMITFNFDLYGEIY